MIETLVFGTLAVADVCLIVAAVFFGWRPLSGVFRHIGRHALRFIGTFLGVLMVLTIAIPLVDTAFYTRGIVFPDELMIYFAPAFMLITATAAALYLVWRAERA